MEKFSINALASGKKEMKKVREYLRSKGFKVQKRKDRTYSYYLSNNNGCGIYEGEFRYEALMCGSELELTLPKDWDKLVKMIEDKPVKDEFKEGDWVKINDNYIGSSFKIGDMVRLIPSQGKGGSFAAKGMTPKGWFMSDSITKATPAEVQSHLESELKERGLTLHSPIKAVRSLKKNEQWGESYGCTYAEGESQIRAVGSGFKYNPKTDTLYNYGFDAGVVYEKGVFATLKETVPEILGYKLERAYGAWKHGEMWNCGCIEFDLPLIDRLRTVMSEAGITEITIKDKYKVTKSQIEEVYNYVESN